MENKLIADLALILVVAGITTLIFKKLKQPLVLGYIVAGFLTGPHFSWVPTIMDHHSIEIWAEIGVIFLMFALGLEFSFYKLKKVGSAAFIATGVAVTGMLIIGYSAGSLLGWNHMNSLFLGGMLSMSSTAIIIKAFDDLGLKDEPFAGMVLAVLIIEDIVGIIMMVLLSTLATATANVSPLELGMGIGKLFFCLILWFVLGMYLIPSLFKRYADLFNDETLIVVSIGLCLLMVVIAEGAGFSSALGAFIMGSLIAEAPSAEHIEHLVKPVKDLFGAVFFVSVGMLVNPSLLLQYAVPVLILILVTIIGQITCATLGMLAAGQSLKSALRAGFCLCQIGEFSFILASMGTELGVTSDFLYPIIVAVSVITTFTTPFCIGLSEGAYTKLLKILPAKVLNYLDNYTSLDDTATQDNEWKELLIDYGTRLSICVVLLISIAIASQSILLPYLQQDLALPYANYITAGITLVFMAPLLCVMLQNTAGSANHFSSLWFKRKVNHIPLRILVLFKVLLATIALYFVFHGLVGWHGSLGILVSVTTAYLISRNNWLMGQYIRLENRFLVNLNEKHMRDLGKVKATAGWFDEQLYLVAYKLEPGSPLAEKQLKDLRFGEEYGCDIVYTSCSHDINFMPNGKDEIHHGATIMLIGMESNHKAFANAIKQRDLKVTIAHSPQTLRDYMLDDTVPRDQQLFTISVPVGEKSELLGKSIRSSNIRGNWQCMVVGLEHGNFTLPTPDIDQLFEKGDLLWILGRPSHLQRLVMEEKI